MARSLMTHHSAHYWYRRGLRAADRETAELYATRLTKAGFAGHANLVLQAHSPEAPKVETPKPARKRTKKS